jgi:hypothetical protein
MLIENLKNLRSKVMKGIKLNVGLVKKIKIGILNHKVEAKKEMSQIELIEPPEEKNNKLQQINFNTSGEDNTDEREDEYEYNYNNSTSTNTTRNYNSNKYDDIDKDDQGNDKEDVDDEKPTTIAYPKSENQPNDKSNNSTNITNVSNEKSKTNIIDEDIFAKLESRLERLNEKIDKLSNDCKKEPKSKESDAEKNENDEKEYGATSKTNKTEPNNNSTHTNTKAGREEEEDLVDKNDSILKMLFKQKQDDLDVDIINLSEDIYRNLLLK